MLAGHKAALSVPRIPVGIIGGVAENAGLSRLLVELHDPVVGDVGEQQIAALGEIGRPFGPAHPGGDLFDRARIDPVFRKGRIQDLYSWVRIALVRRERE